MVKKHKDETGSVQAVLIIAVIIIILSTLGYIFGTRFLAPKAQAPQYMNSGTRSMRDSSSNATPSSEQNQADTQRKIDAERFISAVVNYQSDNRGQVPSEGSLESVVSEYITKDGSSFSDPSGKSYGFVAMQPVAAGQLYYREGVVCNESDSGFLPGTSRQVGVIVKLTKDYYCTNT